MDAVLSSIKSTLDSSAVLAGDTNIDLLSSSMARDMHEQMLDTYQLSCHITKPSRKGKTWIDHISSNINKNKILHSDIFPRPAIIDHDAHYIVINLVTNNFEISYKIIRNFKKFDLEIFNKYFKAFPS